MRAYLAAIIMLALLPTPARAQSGVDVSPIIPVHPDVPTIVQLPDEIERVQLRHGGEMMVRGIGSKLYVRPRWDTPAGVEALLEVKTRTLHRIIILQVVERAEDATQEIVVPAVATADGTEQEARDVPPAAPAEDMPAVSPSTHAPGPVVPPADLERTAGSTEPTNSTAPFDFSAHGVIGLGVTGLDLPGHGPLTGFQPHYALGIRSPASLQAPGGPWRPRPAVRYSQDR